MCTGSRNWERNVAEVLLTDVPAGHSLYLGVVQRSHLLQMRAAGKLGDNVNSTQAIKLPKAYIQAAKLLIDSVSLVTAFLLAYVFRFDGLPPEQFLKQLVVLSPYVVLAQLSAMHISGIASFSWRYIGLRECIRIARVMMIPSALLLFARLAAPSLRELMPHAIYLQVPIGVVLFNYVGAVAAVIGARILRRILTERYEIKQRRFDRDVTRTVLVGAGHGGLLIAREIEQRPELGIEAVGFLDDDTRKHGTVIHGLRVLGSIGQMREFRERFAVEQALVTVSNIDGKNLRTIVEECDQAGLPTKIIPGLHEIVGGKARITKIREVSIEDLLRRKPVELDLQGLSRFIQDDTILVTGAGGSIGSELCRQVFRFAPKTIVMVERSENALFEIERELRNISLSSSIELVPAVGDITDSERMREVIRESRPSLILHAATHKHVPMMEANPAEAIKNNLGGTINLVDIAGEERVPSFVMISTDKAVNPTSIMGASKRSAELYIQSVRRKYSDTKYASVRFGNVLGSNGSVVPIFRQQIAQGGPVTVTHPEMQRYFMTIPEASQLVLQAGALSEDGDIFILDMGDPVKIVDLAKDLIRLSGFEVDKDIEIKFSGIRPGEKLFEELNDNLDELTGTRHASIFVVPEATQEVAESVGNELKSFVADVRGLSEAQIYGTLKGFIPEFTATKYRYLNAKDLRESTNVIDLKKLSSS